MTTIELRFPAHRFHATPWGRHVNEGVPEWPPSPYRLLRALYDAWKRKHLSLPGSAVETIFQALAEEAPQYVLPRAVAAHTRSYLSSNTLDPNDKSLIFDGFVALDPNAACYIKWPDLMLTTEQRDILGQLLSSLNYLGRSESWVEARLFDADTPSAVLCTRLGGGEQSGEIVPVACVVAASQYNEKCPWMDALAYSTAEFLSDRRSAPPLMRPVPYLRPQGALVSHVAKHPRRSVASVNAVLLALDATVLPLVTATLEIAEQIRVRLMGIHKRITGDPTRMSAKFCGKAASGTPLTGHEHVFILPLGNSKGRIDRVLLYTRAASGFDSDELRAILGLRTLYQRNRDQPVRTVVTWKGTADDPQVRRSVTTVASTTPFVTPRHWRKGRGTSEEFLKEEVRRECHNHKLPEVAAVEFLRRTPGLFEWIEFRRNRKKDPPRAGYGFEIRFKEAVKVPFSLGYGCHFGLGQFDAEHHSGG
jgi:CRISPR-associated protein Csb2